MKDSPEQLPLLLSLCGLPVHNSKENESIKETRRPEVKIIFDHYIFDEPNPHLQIFLARVFPKLLTKIQNKMRQIM